MTQTERRVRDLENEKITVESVKKEATEAGILAVVKGAKDLVVREVTKATKHVSKDTGEEGATNKPWLAPMLMGVLSAIGMFLKKEAVA